MRYRSIPIVFALLMFAVTGCLHLRDRHIEKEVIIPEKRTLLISQDILSEKIDHLLEILKQDTLSSQDRSKALKLLETYRFLNEMSSEPIKDSDYPRIIDAMFNCLIYIDKDYFAKAPETAQNVPSFMTSYATKRKDILDAYLKGNHMTVINLCFEIKGEFGSESISPEIGLLFALSLAQEAMFEEAISVGEGISRKLEEKPDLIFLRAKLAEWKLQRGRKEDASSAYEKLADILDKKQVLLLALQKQISEYREKPVEKQKRHTLKKHGLSFSAQKDTTLDQLLTKVDELVLDKKFEEARDMLILKKMDLSSGSEMEAINEALKKLDTAEESFMEQRISSISKEKSIIYRAKKLMEEEKFEEALSILEQLGEKQISSDETTRIRKYATERAVNKNRNRAAKLFLAARQTGDPEKKKEYLISSYKILKSSLDKYPSSILNNKINSHIIKIRKELTKLGKPLPLEK